ncbi:MAG: glycosyltransferase family 2 protein [Phormidesmis sp.]
MSDLPLISVVIPTCDRERILPISLESVIHQTHENLQVIVVDDGSKDDTEAVVKGYQNPKIQYVRHSRNMGGAAARNTGIDLARGDYIAFIDSDDAWVPDKLERQYAHIQSHPCSENVVSYTQVFHSAEGISQDTFDKFDPDFYLPQRGKDKSETLGDYLFCNKGKTLTSTLMLHQKLAKSTRFRDDLKKHQDWDFCLRLEAKGAAFAFLHQPLTIWNGDSSFEHVGRNPNYELSELWLKECKQYLSAQAATKFNLEKILPALTAKKIRKPYAQRLLVEGCLAGQLSLKQFLRRSKGVWI